MCFSQRMTSQSFPSDPNLVLTWLQDMFDLILIRCRFAFPLQIQSHGPAIITWDGSSWYRKLFFLSMTNLSGKRGANVKPCWKRSHEKFSISVISEWREIDGQALINPCRLVVKHQPINPSMPPNFRLVYFFFFEGGFISHSSHSFSHYSKTIHFLWTRPYFRWLQTTKEDIELRLNKHTYPKSHDGWWTGRSALDDFWRVAVWSALDEFWRVVVLHSLLYLSVDVFETGFKGIACILYQ